MVNELPSERLKLIQKCIELVPVIVLGSGASAAYGLAGMWELARYLISNIIPDSLEEQVWEKFKAELDKGTDLEQALHLIPLSGELEKDIVLKTKQLISAKDIEIRNKIITNEINMPLSRLVQHFSRTASPQTKIITTNYDRLAEYAVDQAGLRLYTGFEGHYMKEFKRITPRLIDNQTVEILKVHGSLDWYKGPDQRILALPDEFHSDVEFSPVMVTPGSGKYLHTHDDPFRTLISKTDEIFSRAKSILIIGYGFNDSHIQPRLYEKMRDTKTPILILAKELTESAKHFIKENKHSSIIGIEEHGGGSRVISSNTEDFNIDSSIWNLDRLLEIVI